MNDTSRSARSLPARVAIMRALPGLGDMLTAVPALRALRAGLPQAHITLIALAWARSFFERFGFYFDDFLEFPGYPGLTEAVPGPQQVQAFLYQAQQRRFDLALQMHGSGVISNPVTVLLGASLNAGYYVPGHYCPDPERFLPFSEHESEIRRNLRLVTFLGLSAQGEDLEFPIHEQDRKELDRILAIKALRPGSYVCVHPGAREPTRRWPPERFAQVADALARRGFQVVLTGSGEEASIVQKVANAMEIKPFNLAGQTGLGAFAALLAASRLLVSNDTGVSHLASALRTPSVIVFTSSNPNRWAPLDRQRHRILAPPGSGEPLDGGDINSVPVEKVLAEAAELLQEETVNAA